jgi:hypothetical protein
MAGQAGEGNPIFRAHIDTTLTLYNRNFYNSETFLEACPVAGKYIPVITCLGMGTTPTADENQLYRSTQKHSTYMT